jgi:lactate racemase
MLSIFSVGYGKNTVSFRIEDHLNPTVCAYKEGSDRTSQEVIQNALANPMGTSLLHELAKDKRQAVILISDISRLAPSYLFLPQIIAELNRGGLVDSQIKIVVSLGMHRKQTAEELQMLVGNELYQRIQVLNHSPLPEDCVHFGTTKLGTPIEIFRTVAEADLRIATGNIEPHGLAGMSGGAKALMPGVASQRSIEQNHALSIKFRASPGELNSPLRQDMEEFLAYVPIDFLFNTIVNHKQEVIDAACGHVILAHRELAQKAKDRFLVPVTECCDRVIVSSGGAPKDLQLYQAVKTLQNAAKLVKPGGEILLIARCQELFGNGLFQYWVETIQDQEKMTAMLQANFVLGPHKIMHIQQVLKNHPVYFYSDMPDALVELVGFEPVKDLQAYVDRYFHTGKIVIMPVGSLTFPDLKGEQ